MNPNEFGLYMIILPHEARFCTIFGKIFKENEKSQPLWLTLNDLYFALNMDFQRKKPIFAYKTSYFQFGTLKYIDVVSAAEQRLGNFRSNVGNYQSAFNGLNVSVSQIVRELPSATMGANMFFLAISNNIPMLVDEINKLRAANKLAMKEGKQGVPILKQLGAAVFSWNSLISVGITLLTVYGKDIVSWIGNLFKGKQTIDAAKWSMEQMNAAMAEGRRNAQEEITKLDILYNAATDLAKPYEERATAVRKLQELYPAYFKNMQEEAIIAGNAIQIYRDLKNSIIEIAQARAAESLIEENEKKLLLIKKQSGAYDEYVKALKNVRITQSEYNKATAKGKGKISDIGIYGSYAQYDNDSLERYNAAKLRLGEALAAIRDSLDKAGDDGRAVWNRIQDEFDGDVIRFVESLEAGNKRLSKEAEKLYTTLTPEEQNKNYEKVEKDALKTAKTRAKAIKEAKDAALKAEKDYFQLVQQMRTKTKESELKSISEQNSVAKKSAEKRIGEIDILLKTAEGEQAAWLLQEKETLNKRILALDEKYQKDRISVEAKYSEEALRKELAREEARIRARLGMDAQMDALARAQVKNENYSDLKSEDNGKRLSAQRAIAQEELRIAMDKYQALLSMDEATKESLYDSDVAYQTAVLNGEMAVQDAKLETARITKEQAEYQLNTTLTAMSTISGAAANLFNTLAEDNAEFAEFAKLLALFNIGVNTALAISEAIAGNAARPIKMAAAIAAVLSAIAQAYQVLNQAEKPATPKFSRGGLVTGPGTGTSDSIPARLSNGEAVMTARAVVDWGPVLSMMNVSSGGNAIPTSHLPERRAGGMREMEQMLRRVMREMPNPVVTVKEIDNVKHTINVLDDESRYTGRKNKK